MMLQMRTDPLSSVFFAVLSTQKVLRPLPKLARPWRMMKFSKSTQTMIDILQLHIFAAMAMRLGHLVTEFKLACRIMLSTPTISWRPLLRSLSLLYWAWRHWHYTNYALQVMKDLDLDRTPCYNVADLFEHFLKFDASYYELK